MTYIGALISTYIPLWSRSTPALQGVRGYGRVNYWYASKSALRKDLARCASEGVRCYHIEYSGWADTLIYDDDARRRKARKMYRWLIRRCRALGMWLMVSVVNDNLGSRKYGDGGRHVIDYYTAILGEIDYIRKCGSRGVILQPVAETQTDGGRSVEAYCETQLSGWTLCYNGRGGQPTTTGGMAYRAYHPATTDAAAKQRGGAIITSDHGQLIRWLHGGYDGTISEPRCKQFFQASAGSPLIVVYHFLQRTHDRRTIEIIGRT